jgi:hypothetical protein
MQETLRTLRWSEMSVPALTNKSRLITSAYLRGLRRGGAVAKISEPGLPAGCTREMIDEACQETMGKPVTDTRFRHLSSWKPHGAFLVEAAASDGEVMPLIFKRTVATPEFNPILDRLPFTPGPPEYAILASPQGPLGVFLPRVFFINEVQDGVEHVMLSENLDVSHRRLGRDDVIGLIDHLGDFHAALAEQASATQHGPLIDYLAIRADLPEFFEYRLEEHYQERGDRIVGRLLRQFQRVAQTYQSADLPAKAIGIVHGDPNLSNIRVPRDGAGPPKFIDWEWAGSHLLQIDLAAVLKFASPRLERNALRRYAKLNPELSEDTHRRLYYWCKLDRSLLDVCLMATLAENPAPRRLDVDVFLRRSARAALHAYTQLQRS